MMMDNWVQFSGHNSQREFTPVPIPDPARGVVPPKKQGTTAGRHPQHRRAPHPALDTDTCPCFSHGAAPPNGWGTKVVRTPKHHRTLHPAHGPVPAPPPCPPHVPVPAGCVTPRTGGEQKRRAALNIVAPSTLPLAMSLPLSLSLLPSLPMVLFPRARGEQKRHAPQTFVAHATLPMTLPLALPPPLPVALLPQTGGPPPQASFWHHIGINCVCVV